MHPGTPTVGLSGSAPYWALTPPAAAIDRPPVDAAADVARPSRPSTAAWSMGKAEPHWER